MKLKKKKTQEGSIFELQFKRSKSVNIFKMAKKKREMLVKIKQPDTIMVILFS